MDKKSSIGDNNHQKVTITDCRRAGFCVAGVRTACGPLGLDFRKLVREGIPLEEVENIEDVNVQRAVRIARERIGADGR